jgi:signal transduction histidine kinase
MSEPSKGARPANRDLLSKLSRYEALFELTRAINAATDIESVGQVLARRLKFVVDVYAWRYFCFDGDPDDEEGAPVAIVVDGHRGKADVMRTTPDALSGFELELWQDHKPRLLCGAPMREALGELPSHFQKDDLDQISVNTVVEDGKTQAMHLFCKRRGPFNEIDGKCLTMVSGFFHRKIHMLWEQQKLRDLEQAYLQQEVTLRQSEKLATLGRLSAGLAHELNNPTAAAGQGAEQLKDSIARLERAQFALGAAGLSQEQHAQVRTLERLAEERAKTPSTLDPVARSDLEQALEDWLDELGVEDPWEPATTLVAMGLSAPELEALTRVFAPEVARLVVDFVASQFAAYALLEEIGHGARRIAAIVKALKGYSYMDQAPVQAVDVREGLRDTLVMMRSRLREHIALETDFAEDLPKIQGYGSELNQVWTNLIDNAVSAMDGKGSLELKAFESEGFVVVEVADSGPGIPLEAQAKIFDPFFTTKPPGEGTGLGLNISHGIVVEKHRGQILVASVPGDTRFTIRLPIERVS